MRNAPHKQSRSRRPQGKPAAFVIQPFRQPEGKARQKGKAGTRADSSQHPKPNRAATGDGRRHQRTPNKHTETQPARQRERAPAHRSRAKGRRRDTEARGRRRQSTPNTYTETRAGAPSKLTATGAAAGGAPMYTNAAFRKGAAAGWAPMYTGQSFRMGAAQHTWIGFFLTAVIFCYGTSPVNPSVLHVIMHKNGQKPLFFFFFMVYFIYVC